MANAAFNKEHILVAKWRTSSPETFNPKTGEIWNCQYERDKIAIAYACGKVTILSEFYKYSARPGNRKLCRKCATSYGLDPVESTHKHGYLDTQPGKMFGIPTVSKGN